MIMINSQWQGGGEMSTYHGALKLEKMVADTSAAYKKVEVSTSEISLRRHNIIGYEDILKQTADAKQILENEKPDRLLTIGGGCDADVASLAYMNERYKGDLTVLWFDAHGDMNAPEESSTGLFYGMPARLLMQPEYSFTSLISRPVLPSQWIQIGGRDFDRTEVDFMQKYGITRISASLFEEKLELLLSEIRGKGNRHIYIHFDLDVLDPLEWRATPLPVEGGITKSRMNEALNRIATENLCVGMGIYEYAPAEFEDGYIRALIATILE